MANTAVGSIDLGTWHVDEKELHLANNNNTNPTTFVTLVLRCLMPGRLTLQSPQWGPRVFFLIWWRVRRPPGELNNGRG